MTSLRPPKLGTPEAAWQYYSLHLAGSYVLREFFLASNYIQCIRGAEGAGEQLRRNLEAFAKLRRPVPGADLMLASSQGLSTWAREMKKENYHDVYVHAFVGMFAAFEAGIEDTVAAVLRNDRVAAEAASNRHKKGRSYLVSEWPWSETACVELAGKLDKLASSIEGGGGNLFQRLKTVFSWLDIDIHTNEKSIADLAEANLLRNVTLHRYGEIGESDATRFPALRAWVGEVVPIDEARFTRYYHALSGTISAVMAGISSSRHCQQS